MEIDDVQYWRLREDRQHGWGVGVLENKEEYGNILTTINGKDVVNMSHTFWGMTNIIKVPIIPNTIKYMDYTFYYCPNLTEITINSDLLSYNGMLNYTNVNKINGSISSELKKKILKTSSSNNISKYYTGITDTTMYGTDEAYNYGNNTYLLDEQLPTIQTGDVVLSGDYEYRYNMEYNGSNKWTTNEELNGWGVRVRDDSKSSYGEILTSINNKNIVSLQSAFSGCSYLTTSPVIPYGVENMNSTFGGTGSFGDGMMDISNMVIPNSVKTMQWTFAGNWGIKGKLVIPESVKDITGVASESGVSSLEINGNPEKYEQALFICGVREITGTISEDLKPKILATMYINMSSLDEYINTGIYLSGGNPLAESYSYDYMESLTYPCWGNNKPEELYLNGEIPSIIRDGDIFVKGEYEYKYNYYFDNDSRIWVENTSQNGWGVRFGNADYKEDPNNSLDSIGGKPVIK